MVILCLEKDTFWLYCILSTKIDENLIVIFTKINELFSSVVLKIYTVYKHLKILIQPILYAIDNIIIKLIL